MRDTGTEMSCLMLAPSCFCASEADSRSFHRARAWAGLPASTASVISSCAKAAANRASKVTTLAITRRASPS